MNQDWLDIGLFGALLEKLDSTRRWFGSQDEQGVVAVGELESSPLAWPDLALRLKRGAGLAGFSAEHGSQLAAAIGELYANVIEHSRRTETGYVAYSAGRGCFEFVVADAGVGVLESLRSNPRFERLQDSGTALELALGEGVSRHSAPDRGFGFRPLFVGLANISRSIRFRSGDYGRLIERHENGTIGSRTVQLASVEGLFCTVRCDVDGLAAAT